MSMGMATRRDAPAGTIRSLERCASDGAAMAKVDHIARKAHTISFMETKNKAITAMRAQSPHEGRGSVLPSCMPRPNNEPIDKNNRGPIRGDSLIWSRH